MIAHTASRLVEGRLPVTVPLGGAGSGFLRLWLINNQPRGRRPTLTSRPSGEGQSGGGREMPRWSAERRDVPIARGVRRLASVLACLANTPWVPRKHPASLGAPLPLARSPASRKEEG